MYPVSPQDPWVQVAEVVRLVRSGAAQTRPELADATRLGRNVITQRIQAAQALGLVQPSGQQRSRGGRAAEVWEFAGSHGAILTATVGATGFRAALCDLDGSVLHDRRVPWDGIAAVTEACALVAAAFDGLLAHHTTGAQVWGIGVGLPTPVHQPTGRSLPSVTGGRAGVDWAAGPDVRMWLTRRMGLPVWTESVTNLAALGAAAGPDAPDDLVFVRMDHGIGSGIVSGGRLHRGADSIAGEIGHIVVDPGSDRICLCGRVGCLDAVASRWALEGEAHKALAQGLSPHLTRTGAPVSLEHVAAGATAGDPACAELVLRAGEATGRALAPVVTWFAPREVVVGGNALADNAMFQGALTRAVTTHALGASVRGLRLRPGASDRGEEVAGAAAMVVEALLAPEYLAEWAPGGFPLDVERLIAKHADTLA